MRVNHPIFILSLYALEAGQEPKTLVGQEPKTLVGESLVTSCFSFLFFFLISSQ